MISFGAYIANVYPYCYTMVPILLKYPISLLYGRMTELGLPREKYEWYLDLCRNGTVKHAGFTLNFDLMVLFMTGLSNVRDVIPFPRSYGKANN